MSTTVTMDTPIAASLMFRPETFFVGETRGGGLVRDAFGKVVRRYEVTTRGQRDTAYGAIRFEETFAFDDGEVETWRWALTVSGGRYVFSETRAGSGIVGKYVGDDYVLSFHRPTGRGAGLAVRTYHTRFTVLAPSTALKTSRVSVFGAPVGSLTAYLQRLEEPPSSGRSAWA